MYTAYLKASWWVFLVTGLLGLIFGALFFTYPEPTFSLFVLFFGIWALLTGLASVIGALANRKYVDHFWSTLLFGVFALLIGIATFIPGKVATEATFLILVGVYAVLYGLTAILVAWSIRKEVTGEWVLFLSGFFWLFLGFYVFFNLETAGATLAVLLGIYLLINGAIDIITAFRVRSLKVPASY